MKSLSFSLGLVAVILTSFLAFRPVDVLTDTGVTMDDIRQAAIYNLQYEGVYNFKASSLMRKTARRIPTGAQAKAVTMLGQVVRTYIESDAFAQAYRKVMRGQYAVDETYSDANIAAREAELNTVDEATKQQLAAMQQVYGQLEPNMLYTAVKAQLAQQEAELANLEGEDRAMLAKNIAETKKMLAVTTGKPAEFKKQFLAYQKRLLQQGVAKHASEARADLAEAKTQNAQYREQKAALDAHSNYRPQLRKQLQAFVSLCDEVDFKAKVVSNGYRQEFVNPAYQAKSSDWKFLYRLGEEPVMAARAFAQKWLADLK